jgi:hypothetical protein
MVMICRFPAHGPSQSPTAPTFIAQSPPSKIAIARDGPPLIADAKAPSPGRQPNRAEPSRAGESRDVRQSHFLGVEQEFSHPTLRRETKPNAINIQ